MYYPNTTQTPNSLFDTYLKIVSESELKVLLTIIRKTVGRVDALDKSKRLERAWISQKLFVLCCHLSARAVSNAIDKLVEKNLITVTSLKGTVLKTKQARRGSMKLYFSSNLLLESHQKKKKNTHLRP